MYKLNNDVCVIILYSTIEEKHIWQVYVTSKLKKIVLFLYYKRHGMNFHGCEKHMFKSFGCTKICNNSKWTKMSRHEVMPPSTSNSDSRTIFPYHEHNQVSFDNPFINGRAFIYLGISKKSFTFYVFRRVQRSVSIKSS